MCVLYTHLHRLIFEYRMKNISGYSVYDCERRKKGLSKRLRFYFTYRGDMIISKLWNGIELYHIYSFCDLEWQGTWR